MTPDNEAITEAIRPHATSILGTILAWFGVLAVHQQQIEFWLKALSFLFAIIASGVTAWGVIRRELREAKAAKTDTSK